MLTVTAQEGEPWAHVAPFGVLDRPRRWSNGDDFEQLIYVAGTWLVANDGPSAVALTLPRDTVQTRPLNLAAPDRTRFAAVADAATADALASEQPLTLAPGARAYVWVRAGRSVDEWISEQSMLMGRFMPEELVRSLDVDILSRSEGAEGPVDLTRLRLEGVPIVLRMDDWVLNVPLVLRLSDLPTWRVGSL